MHPIVECIVGSERSRWRRLDQMDMQISLLEGERESCGVLSAAGPYPNDGGELLEAGENNGEKHHS